MNKIITISREFGSGGRELGRRIAEILGFAYYDQEIITQIAQKSGLAEEYVNSIVEKRPVTYFPITSAQTLATPLTPAFDFSMKVYTEQINIIEDLATKSDCVIIGRAADYILRDYNPVNLFIHANMDSRMERCRQRATDAEELSDSKLKSHIHTVDKSRAKYYRFFTGLKWGEKENYTLCVNTSGTIIKDIALPLSELLTSILSCRRGGAR